ncbi:MAG: type IV pilin protein [Pseudomonadales bacterium]|nr:type IV pilin protein [Pseudomonadales bacterium]
MNIKFSTGTKSGFTLIELMIVVAIIAIIATVAYPAYTESSKKARRADAKGAMMGFSQAMERHFTENNTYLGAANGGGNTGAPGIYPSEAPIDGGQKFYDLTIQAATATTYTLRATPKNGQAGDGNLEITHTGVKTWDGNAGWD